jgi:group I intron endonuclease
LGTHNLIGHKHSEDTKKQISEATKGENNHFFGKKHSDETKEIIRNKLTGKYYGPTVKVMAVNLTTKEELMFDSMAQAGRTLNLRSGHISSVANGKLKQHKGWYFYKITENLNGN